MSSAEQGASKCSIASMIINARFLGSVKCSSAGAGGFGSVVLGVGKVVGWRHMPKCMTESEK